MRIETFISVRAIDMHPSCILLIPEQNERKVYREVLIAGDLTKEDVYEAAVQFVEFQVSQLANGTLARHCTGSNTVPRTLPGHGPCSRMVEARLTPQSSLTAMTPSTSLNQVCPSSSLAALVLGLSINLSRSV